VLDRVRSELTATDLTPERRRVLLDEGIAANDQLLARLDDTLARISAFRDERAAAARRLRDARRELDDQSVNPSRSRTPVAAAVPGASPRS
jgi:hypothetical protein